VSTAIEEREILSGLRAAQERAADLSREVAVLRARLAQAEGKLALRLDARQTRAILDENADLRRMNDVLLKRNSALHRRERELRRQPTNAL
jgi:hypothetical protein